MESSTFLIYFTGVVCSLIILGVRGIRKIDAGHVGIVETFGVLEGSDFHSNSPKDIKRVMVRQPGLTWIYPWQKLHAISMMERILDLSGKSGGRLVMTHDGTMLRIDSKLRLNPKSDDLYSYLVVLKRPLEHIQGLFTCLLRNELANFKSDPNLLDVSSYAAIRRDRKRLNQNIEKFCKTQIGSNYGVEFQAVDLVDILPPHELEEALNAVHHAQAQSEILVARAEAECQQRILSADKSGAIAKSNALATEKEILKLSKYISTLKKTGTLAEYIQRRRDEVQAESKSLFVSQPTQGAN